MALGKQEEKIYSLVTVNNMTSIDEIAKMLEVDSERTYQIMKEMISTSNNTIGYTNDLALFKNAQINYQNKEIVLAHKIQENLVRQNKIITCSRCGADNTVTEGIATACAYCGLSILAEQTTLSNTSPAMTANTVLNCPNCGTQVIGKQSRKRNGIMILTSICIIALSILAVDAVKWFMLTAGIILFIIGLIGKKISYCICPACGKKQSQRKIFDSFRIDWKHDWFKQWWVLVIAMAIVVVVMNRAVIYISEASIPAINFTIEEMYSNMTENSQPLGIYDVQIIERSNGAYIVGKIKKNSSVPEQSYVILDIEVYDNKGRPIASETIHSEYDKRLLNNGDLYEFEERIYISDENKKATQFKVIKLEEIDKEKVDAEKEERARENAEREAELKSQIEQILADNEFNGETAAKIILAKARGLKLNFIF